MKLQMALQDKDLKIKDLELKNSELLQDGKDIKLKDLQLKTSTLQLNGLELQKVDDVHIQNDSEDHKQKLQPSISHKVKPKRKFKRHRPFRKKSEPVGHKVSKLDEGLAKNDYQCSSLISASIPSLSEEMHYTEIDVIHREIYKPCIEPPHINDPIYALQGDFMSLSDCLNSEWADI